MPNIDTETAILDGKYIVQECVAGNWVSRASSPRRALARNLKWLYKEYSNNHNQFRIVKIEVIR